MNSEQCVGPEVKKTQTTQGTRNHAEWKIKPSKSPARAKHFYEGYLGEKSPQHFTLYPQGASASK